MQYNYSTSYLDIDLNSSITYILLLEAGHNQQVGQTQYTYQRLRQFLNSTVHLRSQYNINTLHVNKQKSMITRKFITQSCYKDKTAIVNTRELFVSFRSTCTSFTIVQSTQVLCHVHLNTEACVEQDKELFVL